MKQELKELVDIVQDVDVAKITIDFDHQDIIDSRDIEERINEFASDFESLLSVLEDAENDEDEEAIEEAEEDLKNWLEENTNEYVSLLAFKEEVESYTSEWRYGADIIAGDYFEDYARQLADDIGAIDRNATWPCNHIDWEAAAEELTNDYSEITFDGVSYWVR